MQHVEGVFSWLFIVLLLDVLLVVLYFIMVREVEIKNSLLWGQYFGEPSAQEETLWMIWVFAAYVAWDIVAYVLVDNPRSGEADTRPEVWKRFKLFAGLIVDHASASFVCLVLTCAAYCLVATSAHGVGAVVLTDAALVVLVFLFSAMKLLEKVLRRGLGEGPLRCRLQQLKRGHPEVAWVYPLFVAFACCLGAAYACELAVR